MICRPHQILFGESNQDERKEHAARTGRERRCIQGLVRKFEGKRPPARPKRRWENDIKMPLQEVALTGLFCFWEGTHRWLL